MVRRSSRNFMNMINPQYCVPFPDPHFNDSIICKWEEFVTKPFSYKDLYRGLDNKSNAKYRGLPAPLPVDEITFILLRICMGAPGCCFHLRNVTTFACFTHVFILPTIFAECPLPVTRQNPSSLSNRMNRHPTDSSSIEQNTIIGSFLTYLLKEL